MVDELRKEVPCREELPAEYDDLCRSIEAAAVAVLEGKTSDRGFRHRPDLATTTDAICS
ncbi:hypothetical protein GOC73_31880 [Sinorhizobium medicae]|nr:hypothetical protein [Sinorhizobium medicae]MDX0686408.1 hypothetical protein [Sinorhizobium medicae]MDX0692463.1 hypothetical protein [Sinorhizobium medicae]MDX0919838.1 hypothetical protein [Sinorhizobium medicae]